MPSNTYPSIIPIQADVVFHIDRFKDDTHAWIVEEFYYDKETHLYKTVFLMEEDI